MRVLHVTPAFWPATYWGGPIITTYYLCNALASLQGVELRVLTTDAAGLRLSEQVKVKDFPVRYSAGYEVYFTRRIAGRGIAPGLLVRLRDMVRWADVVHLQYTYSFPTIPTLAACRLLNKPVVWSPHGALQAAHEWEAASKPILKKMWERVCTAVMPKRCVLHAASEAEKAASLARLPRVTTAVIPHGVDGPVDLPLRVWLPKRALRVMYIGRLDPMKGIENLLRALSLLDKSIAVLDIYGSGDCTYAASLAELGRSLGLNGRMQFHGHVEGEAKQRAFLEANVCVIPSHSENFGMVVAEALVHGVPVIASRATPWAEVEVMGCGLWVDNSPRELAKAIMWMRESDLEAMGGRGRRWMEVAFSWDAVAGRMNDLYRSVV